VSKKKHRPRKNPDPLFDNQPQSLQTLNKVAKRGIRLQERAQWWAQAPNNPDSPTYTG